MYCPSKTKADNGNCGGGFLDNQFYCTGLKPPPEGNYLAGFRSEVLCLFASPPAYFLMLLIRQFLYQLRRRERIAER
jgi:hypothetical protein